MSTVLNAGWRRARKPHGCYLCGRVIAVGERYHYQFQVDYGDAGAWQTCEHCQVYAHLIFQSDQWDEDLGLDFDTAQDFEPRTWAEVRIKAMYLLRWRRRDGALMPVPRLVYARLYFPRRASWEPRFHRIAVACVSSDPTNARAAA